MLNKKMNTYFLCLTQYVNVGDLLINKMLIDEYCRYGTVYLDCPDAPKNFRDFLYENKNVVDINNVYIFSVRSIKIFRFPFLLKKLNISLYSQSPGPIRKKGNVVDRLFSLLLHICLKTRKVPDCRIGSCCSAIEARGGKIKMKSVSEFCIRSISGVNYMKSLGIPNVSYIPDLAYLFHYQVKSLPKKKTAVLSFRTIRIDLPKFTAWLTEIITILLSNNYQIEFFYQVKKDEKFMRDIYQTVKREGVSFNENMIWYDSLDFYADKDIVVSNRLHSLLVGVVYDCIPFAYVDGDSLTRKITDVMESSLPDSELYLSNSEEANKLSHIINNIDFMRAFVSQACIQNAELCRNKIFSIAQRVSHI